MRCGAGLGVGRFCLNCGHRIGEPAPEPVALPVQAADPTAVPPPSAPVTAAVVAPEPSTAPETDPTPGPSAPVHESTWDPREDLLPYEEVDELDLDDPVPGRAWIYWVLAAVVLVGLVFFLLQVFATDEDDTAATDATSSESSAPVDDGQDDATGPEGEESEAPKGVGKRIDLARAATVEVPGTAPPTTDFDGNLVAYEASQMHDGDPSTTWRIAGDASGQALTITLPEPAVIHRVGLVNGYAKQVAGVDWYPNNRRILSVAWGFDDGTTVEQTFAERPTMQLLKVPPVETSTVTITITSVTPPGSGNLGRDYTAISEVAINGRRAG